MQFISNGSSTPLRSRLRQAYIRFVMWLITGMAVVLAKLMRHFLAMRSQPKAVRPVLGTPQLEETYAPPSPTTTFADAYFHRSDWSDNYADTGRGITVHAPRVMIPNKEVPEPIFSKEVMYIPWVSKEQVFSPNHNKEEVLASLYDEIEGAPSELEADLVGKYNSPSIQEALETLKKLAKHLDKDITK